MTPHRLETVRQLVEECRDLPAGRVLCELVEHVEELQGFVRDLAAHLEREPGPLKVAEYFQLRARGLGLREKIGTPTQEDKEQ